jgi:cell cycle arrest protein BUB3
MCRMESRTEFKIKSPPTDAISAVEFGPNSTQFLLVSSWDSTVRLYDIHANTLRLKYNHDLPVLDVAFQVSPYLWLIVMRLVTFCNVKLFIGCCSCL